MDKDEMLKQLRKVSKDAEDYRHRQHRGGVILDPPTANAFDRLAQRVGELESRIARLEAGLSGYNP